MYWRIIGAWGAIYIALAFPLAMFLGKLLHRAWLSTVPVSWLEPGRRPPCLFCDSRLELMWQNDGVWLCCPACGSKLLAENYQALLSNGQEPAD